MAVKWLVLMRFWLLTLGGFFVLCGCNGKTGPVVLDSNNAPLVAQGAALYQDNCARCHGAGLEGQPNWRVRKPDGKLPAPPHNADGHTWHHPNAMLVDVVRNGLVPPNAPAGYKSDMPAFASRLSDAQIGAVLSYIQSRWPADVWQYRKENGL